MLTHCRRHAAECLEISAQSLLTLDRFKQRLEVAFSETAAALALDNLEKQRRAVFHRLGEDLQHVPLVVAIDQNTQLFQFIEGLVDLAYARFQLPVICGRYAQK